MITKAPYLYIMTDETGDKKFESIGETNTFISIPARQSKCSSLVSNHNKNGGFWRESVYIYDNLWMEAVIDDTWISNHHIKLP